MDATEKKKQEEQQKSRPAEPQRRAEDRPRVEIWIHPDGHKDRVTEEEEKEGDLSKLPTTEVLVVSLVLVICDIHGIIKY